MSPATVEPLAQKHERNVRKHQKKEAHLNALETEVVALFVQVCRLLGQPPSLGEIYGLLFVSSKPLALDDLPERLGMSKATASAGLKFLRNFGAVKMVYRAGDRRVLYEAVAELRNLASRFLQDQIIPQLDGGRNRLGYINTILKKLPSEERARFNGRITMLESWEKKMRRFLPIVTDLLGK